MEPVRPDYGGGWIGAVIPTIANGLTPAWLPTAAHDAAGVLLLVLDGLGWSVLEHHREQLQTLGAMAGGAITSVAPSTTAAGLTSISTGVAPSEHGLAGYRIRVAGEPLNVLRWQTSHGPDPRSVQPVPPFLGRSIPVVTRAEFRHSGFTEAHLRDQVLIGWRTTSALVEHCRRLATDRHPLIYAYYDGIDKVAHEYGLRSEFIATEMRDADRLVADLLESLPSDWALVVTADHGQVQVDDDDFVALDAVAAMVAAYSGEGRFRTLHARSGATAELTAACRSAYGQQAWVFTRDQLFDEGWLGPAPSMAVRGRIGDVILAACDPVIFLDPEMPFERVMRSHHGSLTPDEMLVPLIATRR
jgi:hypothetical protein